MGKENQSIVSSMLYECTQPNHNNEGSVQCGWSAANNKCQSLNVLNKREGESLLERSSQTFTSSSSRNHPTDFIIAGCGEGATEEKWTRGLEPMAHLRQHQQPAKQDETPVFLLTDTNNGHQDSGNDLPTTPAHGADPVLSNFYSDPNYGDEEWSYNQIRLTQAWQRGYTGRNIRVRINDSGVLTSHVEFAGRFDRAASCKTRVEPDSPSDAHGTAVAGIVAAAGNNNQCAVGVAPQARLSACYALSPSEAFLGENIHLMDISQNSYERPACGRRRRRRGEEADESSEKNRMLQECPFRVSNPASNPCNVCYNTPGGIGSGHTNPSEACAQKIRQHCRRHYENDVLGCSEFLDLLLANAECRYNVLSDEAREGITRGISQGRNGKGIIFVFASGNSYARGDVTNIKGYTNTRFVISVGAVGKDGIHASYSTPGASIFVSAPGGDVEDARNHITTLASSDTACGFPGLGTSFSCPVVSGVIALMLEANSELSWRDVQGIIARTSQPVYDARDSTANTNAAGFWHSNLYGFGIVDALAAVTAAEVWTPVGPELLLIEESGFVRLPITDDPNTTTESEIVVLDDIIVESVAVFLDVQHLSRGDMDIVLTSPHGTESILHPGKRPENTQLGEDEWWKLLTVRNWGEPSAGSWKLSLTDVKAGEFGTGCVDADYFIEYSGQFVYCRYFEETELCKDGSIDMEFFGTGAFDDLLATRDNGRTLEEACCVCGGGIRREDYQDMLRQWSLVVYGREATDLERGNDTPPPTKSPTKQPTKQPTPAPTKRPTPSPTKRPTPAPTRRPTRKPTTNPTGEPTKSPSISPTGSPSIQPTRSPSILPTNSPTRMPTPDPSSRPTSSPSKKPTLGPSTQPTSSPSIQPTDRPTDQPTAAHSDQPTHTPSTLPTRLPSILPTMPPSADPTKQPTRHPSFAPSIPPTELPTNLPSIQPSLHPSAQPTKLLTNSPTNNPSPGPSHEPTIDDSPSPTVGDGSTESGMTNSPATVPAIVPTTRNPSSALTPLPTRKPSETPSPAPSPGPSQDPGPAPSMTGVSPSPMQGPTAFPTPLPTELSTSIPSKAPVIPTMFLAASKSPSARSDGFQMSQASLTETDESSDVGPLNLPAQSSGNGRINVIRSGKYYWLATVVLTACSISLSFLF